MDKPAYEGTLAAYEGTLKPDSANISQKLVGTSRPQLEAVVHTFLPDTRWCSIHFL